MSCLGRILWLPKCVFWLHRYVTKSIAMSLLICRWQDGYPESWEPEENVSPDLIALFEQQQALMGGTEQQQQQGGGSNGSSSGGGSGGQVAATGQQWQQPGGSAGDGKVLQASAA